MSTSPFTDRLFDEDTLKEVIHEYEGAAATSSHLDLSKAVAKGLITFGKRKFDDVQASPGSPLVPHAVPSTSKATAAAMFTPKYRGKGRGHKRGGGAPRGGKNAPASQKPASQDFAK